MPFFWAHPAVSNPDTVGTKAGQARRGSSIESGRPDGFNSVRGRMGKRDPRGQLVNIHKFI